jgi:hypothetical protein
MKSVNQKIIRITSNSQNILSVIISIILIVIIT